MARVGIRVGMWSWIKFIRIEARKSVNNVFLSASNLQRIIFIFFCLLPIVHILFIFFSHNVEMFKSLSGGVVIYVFFGTNPLITDANVALDAYIAAYETRRTALSTSLHTTSGRMRSFLHEDRIMDVWNGSSATAAHYTLLISRGIFRFQWGRGRGTVRVARSICRLQGANCKIERPLIRGSFASYLLGRRISIEKNYKLDRSFVSNKLAALLLFSKIFN